MLVARYMYTNWIFRKRTTYKFKVPCFSGVTRYWGATAAGIHVEMSFYIAEEWNQNNFGGKRKQEAKKAPINVWTSKFLSHSVWVIILNWSYKVKSVTTKCQTYRLIRVLWVFLVLTLRHLRMLCFFWIFTYTTLILCRLGSKLSILFSCDFFTWGKIDFPTTKLLYIKI